MTDERSDEELAGCAARGDQRAFKQIYQRYKREVFGRVTQILGTVPDREDVLQMVFYQLHRALPSYRREASLKTFLHQITSNVVIDHLRRRRRRPIIQDEEAIGELAATLPDPAERAQLKLLFSKLEEIPPKRRIVFVLIAVKGLSYEDAAEQLGISTGAVRQRLSLARMALSPLFGAAATALLLAWSLT